MKKLLFILLLPLIANAEHHRGHALMHLDSAQAKLDKVVNHIIYLDTCANWDERQLRLFGQLTNYTDIAQEQLDIARSALNDIGNLDALEAARHALVQPHGTMPSGEISATRAMMTVQAVAALFVPNICPESAGAVSQVIVQGGHSWTSFDLAAWHVIDAIREETYQDPAFQ